MSKPKKPTFMTPKGVFVFPKLNAPDTKFKAEGEYSTKLRLEESAAADFRAKYDAFYAQAKEATLAELKQKLTEATDGKEKAKLKKSISEFKETAAPFEDVVDDDGDPTGEVLVKIKMKASYTDKKTGKVKNLKPDIFDAAGKQLKAVPEIWSGTEGYVAGDFNAWFNAKNEFGVSLRLGGVQIIKLASKGGARDAAAYGFGSQEGGYSASEEDENEHGFQDQSNEDGDPRPDPDDF